MHRVIRVPVFLLCIMIGLSVNGRERIRLGVLDFEAKNTNTESAEAVTELLRTSLFNTGRFVVVEREKISQVLEEQKFQSTGLTVMDQAVEIGRLLNVQKIMAGSLSKLGDTFVMNTRIVDVQSGVVDLAVSKKSSGGEENLPEAIDELALTIVDRLGIEGAVIRVDAQKVLVDLGDQDGVRLGQVFDVVRQGETIKDLNGRIIGTEYKDVGTLEIANVESGFSEAKIRSGSGEVKVGDKVRSVAVDPNSETGNYPIEGMWYHIVSMHSDKYLDIKGASAADGANIQLYTPHGKPNQQWMFIRSGAYYKIRSKTSGKCLDVKGASKENGANLQQYTCHSQDNQLWRLEPVGDYFIIVNKNSSKCMDVKGFSKADGANVQQYKSNGGSNQLWQLIPAE
ncbi:RICIN domain-containing protein [bacterium]